MKRLPLSGSLVTAALYSALLVLLPVTLLNPAAWVGSYPVWVIIVFCAVPVTAYLGSVIVLHGRQAKHWPTHLIDQVALGGLAGLLVLLVCLYAVRAGGDSSFSLRSIGLVTSAVVGSVAMYGVPSVWRVTFAGLVIIICAATLVIRQHALSAPPEPRRIVRHLESSLYSIESRVYKNQLPQPFASGGGLTRLESQLLLATGDGDLYRLDEDASRQQLRLDRLPLKVPLNAEEFIQDTGQDINHTWFRVADILATRLGSRIRLYASHHYWKAGEKCFVLRVSQIEVTDDQLSGKKQSGNWETIYESSPCLRLVMRRGPRFAGLQAGGRLALDSDGTLLLTVGDHEFDGVNSDVALPQSMDNSYGKVVAIDLLDRSSSLFAIGLRNPQGLLVRRDGQIWSTEHGPQGGDELNRIQKNGNYGWPEVTYGTEYGSKDWPLSSVAGSHHGFELPVFAWVPAVALSNLIESGSAKFPLWREDLLIGTLRAKQLLRVRVREGRVVLVEPIFLNHRVRDLVETEDGRIVIWTDVDLVFLDSVAEAGPAPAVYATCVACHGHTRVSSGSDAPQLEGIVGSPVAAAQNFNYSPALRRFGGHWTRDRLDQFLADPAGTVPGTTMVFKGIRDEADRKALIDFLESRN